MNDFIPNKLSFQYDACMDLIKSIIDVHLDTLSKYLADVVRGQIWINGNGSHKVMRLFAAALVKETKREITNDHVLLEIGIDTDNLHDDAFVRVYVVLHGNQTNGHLVTKPGQSTWGKHVLDYRVHVPAGNKSYDLPHEFNQDDKMNDILDKVQKNVEQTGQKHVKDFIDAVNHDISKLNWSSFITVG